MTTEQVREKFYFAIDQNLDGKMSATETETVCKFLYEVVKEISANTPTFEQCGRMEPKSDAEIDRCAMRNELRRFGVEVED